MLCSAARITFAAFLSVAMSTTALADRDSESGRGRAGGSGGARRLSDDEARHLRREIDQARREVQRVLAQLRRQFLESPEYTNARSNVITAMRIHAAVRAQALAPLRQSPQYQSIQLEIIALEDQVRVLRAQGAATVKVGVLAERALQSRARLSRLESDALQLHDAYLESRYRLLDAQGEMLSLLRDFDQTVRFDEESLAARARLAAARERLIGRR